jgi:23S rRNA G2445 N2-methylase RlmL
MTMPGLETVAAEEIAQELGGEIKRTAPGLVVFRPARLDRAVLQLRTVEDVFLLLWGTDQLSYRAEDLERIQRWTAREPDWPRMLELHHAIRPKPKGKPTYHLVAQMRGEHGYRRADARKALIRGLAGKLPASWRAADENAAVEIWLTIQGPQAVCGLRLSDRTMRHRTYKAEHLPASLRPVVAAAMVRLAQLRPEHLLLDPACGAGTILAERLAMKRQARVIGGDVEASAVRAAGANLRRLGEPWLARWDACRLPLRDGCVDRIVTNPPFGKQLGEPEEMADFYRRLLAESDRVLKPGGSAVLLVSDAPALEQAARLCGWHKQQRLRIRILGQPAYLYVWVKR